MSKTASEIACWTRANLTVQGYEGLSDADRRALWLGVRFSPALCAGGVALGLVLSSPAVLLALCATAAVGGLASNHPFDHPYNLGLRRLLGGPALPPTPPPRKFACQIATPWIAAIAVAMLAGQDAVAFALGIAIVAVAGLVSTTNFCIPSHVYRLLHRGRGARTAPA